MNGNGREKSPAARLGNEVTSGGKSSTTPTILYPTAFVNPLSIPTAAAGVVNWTVCDSLHTLASELIARGLVKDNDELTEAIGASWARMMNEASYIPPSELEALEGTIEVGHA